MAKVTDNDTTTANNILATTPSDEVTYKIQVPEQKWWDRDNGIWVTIPPYNSEGNVQRPAFFGVRIQDGVGTTTDPKIALECFDMGLLVTPDPHLVMQDKILVEADDMAKSEPTPENTKRVKQVANDVRVWRKARGIGVPEPVTA